MRDTTSSESLDIHSRSVAQRRLIAEGIFASGQENISGGVILLVYALALGANTFQIGLISTAGMLGTALQLVADRLLKIAGSRRRVGCAATALLGAGRLSIALLPYATVWIAAQYLAWGLLAGLVVISGVAQVIEVVRLSWISEVVPENERGRFLGERQLVVQLIGSVIAICAAGFLDWQKGIDAARGLVVCQAYFAIAAFLAVGSIAAFLMMPEPPLRIRNGNGGWHVIVAPFRDAKFFPLMVYSVTWNFAVGFAAPFFNLYLIQVLQMPVSAVAAFNFASQFFSLYCVRLWGRLVDRFGSLPVLRIGVFGKGLYPVAWFLLWPTPETYSTTLLYFLTACVFLFNVLNSANAVSTVSLAMRLMPKDQGTSYLATFRTFANWVHAVSPALAGIISTGLQGIGWSLQFSIFLLFAISAIGRFAALWTLRFVHEPDARKVSRVFAALKRVPGFSFSHGIIPWFRFWGGPFWAGFTVVKIRMGRMVSTWRGAWPGQDNG